MGNPGKENDSHGMAVKCQALYRVISCVFCILFYLIIIATLLGMGLSPFSK